MYLLDTDILSELIKRRPSPHLLARLAQVASETLFTTSISVMELRYGSARRSDHAQFWARVEREILSRVRILDFGAEEAIRAGDLLAALSLRGASIGLEDALIGGVGLAKSYIVVTGNTRHFRRIPGLRVENWLEG